MRFEGRSIVIGAFLASVGGVASCDGCGNAPPPGAGATASASVGAAPSEPPASAEARAPDESIKTIYPTTGVKPEPIAERLCAIMHDAPAAAKARCCGGEKRASLVAPECVRILSFSIQQRALEVDEARVSGCEAALKEALADCDVASSKFPPVDACEDLVRGRAASGASCRSSLECPAGERCHGVSPTRMGTCGAPRKTGILCETGRDPLAGLLRQDLDRSHRECAGHCRSRRCAAPIAAGGACLTDLQCASRACGKSGCMSSPHPGAGQPCREGRCASGLRCSAEDCCEALLAEGEACKRADECKSSRCDRRSTDESGVCKRTCVAVPAIRPSAGSSPAAPPP